jgi:hypothetical protein
MVDLSSNNKDFFEFGLTKYMKSGHRAVLDLQKNPIKLIKIKDLLSPINDRKSSL